MSTLLFKSYMSNLQLMIGIIYILIHIFPWYRHMGKLSLFCFIVMNPAEIYIHQCFFVKYRVQCFICLNKSVFYLFICLFRMIKLLLMEKIQYFVDWQQKVYYTYTNHNDWWNTVSIANAGIEYYFTRWFHQ